ncbi:transglutaminase-like domain-containing protein [Tissierella pigra]|uniref:Transglutaminase domain-containing protein n=1 Tax=Tissierella pigra TaxID=2607614 RepID=A0A6N7XY39_9FIRM|nr:transglutaminase-like domain-containing protein [Tissierella pigra]MSU00700.1 transglutaminase domain-containing protein [Tissierella pigra]
MDKISNKSENLIINLLYASFVFSLVYLFGLGIGLKINIMLQVLIVFLGSMMVKFFLLNPLILYGIIAISSIITILIHRFAAPILFTIVERVLYLSKNIIANFRGKENIASDNILLFWGILIILVSLFTAFILFRGKTIYLLLPIYISTFLYYWYNFFNQAYWMISIFLIAFFILMGLDKYSKKKIQNLYAPWLKTLTNYSILIVFIALLLPKNYNYIEWFWLQQKVYTAFPFVENLRSYDKYTRKSGEAILFDFSTTGFQSKISKLGGPVNLSNKKIMTVYADDSIYLRGNVKHVYTGDSWDSILKPLYDYKLGEDFSKLTYKEQQYFYKEEHIIITNNDFASTTLFSPYKPSKVNFKDNHILKVNNDDVIIFPNGVYDRESYTIEIQKPLPYGILVSTGMENKKTYLPDLNIYLQIPNEKITERIRNLVNEIVKDAENDFGKAVAIENYLRTNYKYSLDVKYVPEHREFVDYFLFEEKRGYCTYYATSMAVMLRLAEIPSRYIEGYLAKDLIEDGIYEVKHENAHAWVEAFIEPVGWMTFEPTPAYPVESRLENYQLNESHKNMELNESRENIRTHRNDIDGQIIDSDQIAMDEMKPNYEENYEDTSTGLPSNTIGLFIVLLLLIIPLKSLVGLLQYSYGEAKAKKLSNNKRVIYLYQQILRLKELMGCPQLYGETHYEYANRIAYKFHSYDDIGIKEITEIFVKSKYSNSISSDENVLKLEMYRKTMEKRLKNYLGKMRYYYQKYVKGIY